MGVLQSAPYFPAKIDALMNMVNSEHHLSATMITGRTHRMTEMIARLAPGATLEQARAEVAGITDRVHRQYPESYDAGSHFQVTVTPFRDVLGAEGEADALSVDGRGGVRVDHRVRERREPHADARRAARARAGHSRRARRRRGAAPQAVARRESAARVDRERARTRDRVRRRADVDGARGAVQSARRRDSHRRRRARIHAAARRRRLHHSVVRAESGERGVAERVAVGGCAASRPTSAANGCSRRSWSRRSRSR